MSMGQSVAFTMSVAQQCYVPQDLEQSHLSHNVNFLY